MNLGRSRWQQARRRWLTGEFGRFVAVGACNTGFSYAVYCLALFLGLRFQFASLVSLVCGIAVGFRAHGILVFRNASWQRIYRYIALWTIIYLGNIAGIAWLMHTGMDAYWAGAVLAPVLVVVSYGLQKIWVFAASPTRAHAMNEPEPRESVFACMVCAHADADDVLRDCHDLYLGSSGAVDYVRCRGCGLVQQSPLLQNVQRFYDDYPVHAPKSRLHRWLQRALLSAVYVPPDQLPAGARVLEFGCGDGWYLQWCKRYGIDIVGYEMAHDHARRLSEHLRVPIYSDMATLLAERARSVDLITLHFVAEHLLDLRGTLAPLSQLLRPGGKIRYVVPNIDSWEFRWFGRRWHGLDPPRHISFPDAALARRLAAELALEFEGEQNASCPNGFAGSVATALTGRFRQWLFVAAMPLAVLVTRAFPSGNRAYVLRAPRQPTQ